MLVGLQQRIVPLQLWALNLRSMSALSLWPAPGSLPVDASQAGKLCQSLAATAISTLRVNLKSLPHSSADIYSAKTDLPTQHNQHEWEQGQEQYLKHSCV